MKTMNYFPFYETLLKSGKMTTGFRLGDKSKLYEIGEVIMLTVGWSESYLKELGQIKITEVKYKQLNELSEDDFKTQSPDCDSLERAVLTLSSIYRKEVSPADRVTVIKWEVQFTKKKPIEPISATRKTVTSRQKTTIL